MAHGMLKLIKHTCCQFGVCFRMQRQSSKVDGKERSGWGRFGEDFKKRVRVLFVWGGGGKKLG